MPFTPFHFGPGALLHSVAPRHVSFLAFCAANVAVDLEPLYKLQRARFPVHAYFHSYVGVTVVWCAAVAAFWLLHRPGVARHLPNFLDWKELTLRPVAIGAALGAYTHIALDSLMHHDIKPLWPFSSRNVLLDAISLDTLHWACVGAGILGLAILGVRWRIGR